MKSTILLLLSVIGLSMLACSLGGIVATPTPNPTDTPIPTNTPFPTATPTETPTPLPTSTPQPTEAAQQPTALPNTEQSANPLKLEDGSQQFTDASAGYQIILPADWVVIDPSQGDIEESLEALLGNNPNFEQVLTMIQSMDPSMFRLFMVDTNPNHILDATIVNGNIVYTENAAAAALPLEMLVEANAQMLPEMIEGVKILSQGVEENALGTPQGWLETEMEVAQSSGEKIPMRQKIAMTTLPNGLLVVTFSAHRDMYDDVLPSFNQILDTLQATAP